VARVTPQEPTAQVPTEVRVAVEVAASDASACADETHRRRSIQGDREPCCHLMICGYIFGGVNITWTSVVGIRARIVKR
jgi:hypothetical protein